MQTKQIAATFAAAVAIAIGGISLASTATRAADYPLEGYRSFEDCDRCDYSPYRHYGWRHGWGRTFEHETVIERPVVIERKVIVERPIIERRVVFERPIIERRVVVERPAIVEHRAVIVHPVPPIRVISGPDCDWC